MNVIRCTVVDGQGAVSFIVHADALPALTASCSASPSSLEELLEGNDAGAIDVFGESAALLHAVFGSAAASVEEALDGWDFPAALQALRAAKADRDELKEAHKD